MKCDLCKFFEAEISDEVENEATGERMTVDLCPECHKKSLDRRSDKSVTFGTELRLRERNET